MANIKSSKKDIRRTKTRREANSQKKSRLRTFDKKIRLLVDEGEVKEAQDRFHTYSSLLDRAGKRNLIHSRQADRRKSRMASLIGLSGSVTAPAPEPKKETTEVSAEEAAV